MDEHVATDGPRKPGRSHQRLTHEQREELIDYAVQIYGLYPRLRALLKAIQNKSKNFKDGGLCSKACSQILARARERLQSQTRPEFGDVAMEVWRRLKDIYAMAASRGGRGSPRAPVPSKASTIQPASASCRSKREKSSADMTGWIGTSVLRRI